MSEGAAEYENTEERKRDDEHVKVPIVSSTNTVANPGTVMIESLCNKNKTLIEKRLLINQR